MIDSIGSFIRKNWQGAFIVSAAIVLFVVIASMGGCSWGDLITRKVPTEVQLATGAAPRVTLNEAEILLGSYRDQIKLEYDRRVAVGQLFAETIADGWELAGFFAAATNLGITSIASGAWGGIPAGGAAIGLLTFLGGLVMKGPGTGKEKEKSFNKGQEAAITLLRSMNPDLVVPEKLESPT